jgi:hypothetical protein
VAPLLVCGQSAGSEGVRQAAEGPEEQEKSIWQTDCAEGRYQVLRDEKDHQED